MSYWTSSTRRIWSVNWGCIVFDVINFIIMAIRLFCLRAGPVTPWLINVAFIYLFGWCFSVYSRKISHIPLSYLHYDSGESQHELELNWQQPYWWDHVNDRPSPRADTLKTTHGSRVRSEGIGRRQDECVFLEYFTRTVATSLPGKEGLALRDDFTIVPQRSIHVGRNHESKQLVKNKQTNKLINKERQKEKSPIQTLHESSGSGKTSRTLPWN